MKPRIVLYGHAAHANDDGNCQIPENTTLTLYAPLGALMDQTVCTALVNSEVITSKDIESSRNATFFLNHGATLPSVEPQEKLGDYPRLFRAGESVPNFFLNPAELVKTDTKAVNPTPTRVETVSSTTMLIDLLDKHRGNDVHWAACSFSNTPDAKAVGNGYAYRFRPTSQLRALYAPRLTDEEKRAKRAQRFGVTNPAPADNTSIAPTPALSRLRQAQQARPNHIAKREPSYSGNRVDPYPQRIIRVQR